MSELALIILTKSVRQHAFALYAPVILSRILLRARINLARYSALSPPPVILNYNPPNNPTKQGETPCIAPW